MYSDLKILAYQIVTDNFITEPKYTLEEKLRLCNEILEQKKGETEIDLAADYDEMLQKRDQINFQLELLNRLN